jgi:hypothetical protein
MMARRLLVLASVLLLAGVVSAADAVGASKAKISLTGPTANVRLGTPYTYTVTITPDRTYSKAWLRLGVSESACSFGRAIHLTAHHASVVKFAVSFGTTFGMSTAGVVASAIARTPNSGFVPIAYRKLLLTPEPGQPEGSALGTPCPGGESENI